MNYRRRPTSRLRRFTKYSLIGAGITAALVTQLRFTYARGHSMEPSIHDGDLLISESFPFLERRVGLESIVTFECPVPPGIEFVKRVRSLPGDPVFYAHRKTVVPADHYFVTGDNCEISVDSREFGPMRIRGRLLFLYCPHEHTLKFTPPSPEKNAHLPPK